MKQELNIRNRFGALLALILLAPAIWAQQMTDRHIPVGAYPALKSEYTTAGTVVAVDEEARTLTLKDNDAERQYRLTDATKIWLDRSRLQQPTMDGSLADIAAGLEAEVRSLGPGQADVAYWVKVRIPAP